jgi:hypothetical protein
MKIMAINRWKAEDPAYLIPEKHILISVTDPNDAADIPERDTCQDILRLEFNDSYRFGTEGVARVMFSEEQAQQVIDFVNKYHTKVPLLVVHCFAGMNRSPAIAAAVARMLGQSDEYFFKNHEPDSWVYRTLLYVAQTQIQTSETENIQIVVCEKCKHWEEMPADMPRHKMQTFEMVSIHADGTAQ